MARCGGGGRRAHPWGARQARRAFWYGGGAAARRHAAARGACVRKNVRALTAKMLKEVACYSTESEISTGGLERLGGGSDECMRVRRRGFRTVPYVEPGRGFAPSCAVRRSGDAQIWGGAARRMEDANNGTVCTPRRRFDRRHKRRATAIAKHVDALARGARAVEEPAPVGDDEISVAAFAARFARRAVADAVALQLIAT